MILPWTVRASEEAVKAVPKSYREASLALGATKWQTIRNVVLKNAIPGITTGSILGLGKAMGEAAVILLVMGGTISGFLPTSIFDNALTLPVYLYTLATQGNSPMAFEKAYGTALVLLAMFFMMSLFAMFIRNRYARRQ
jgi:phosphate transport system permease protein